MTGVGRFTLPPAYNPSFCDAPAAPEGSKIAAMLTSYAFGIEDLDAVSDEDRAEYEKEFETSYGITFEEAKESIPEIVSYFFQKTDCNVGENTTWYEAIEAVFGGNRDGN